MASISVKDIEGQCQECSVSLLYSTCQETRKQLVDSMVINYCPRHAAADEMYGACRAGQAYDRAIRRCANDPDKMATYCTAQGDSLDTLYMIWMLKINIALALADDDKEPELIELSDGSIGTN